MKLAPRVKKTERSKREASSDGVSEILALVYGEKCRAAYGKSHSDCDPDDVRQEVAIKVVEQFLKIDSPQLTPNWVCTVAKNYRRDQARKKTTTRFKGGVTPRSVVRVFVATPRVSSSSARLA
jgi:DNA-directed RNA polymerase specialized sigma24 family protein